MGKGWVVLLMLLLMPPPAVSSAQEKVQVQGLWKSLGSSSQRIFRDLSTGGQTNTGGSAPPPEPPSPPKTCEPQPQYDNCRKIDEGRKMECRGTVTRIVYDLRSDQQPLHGTSLREDGTYACRADLQVPNPDNPAEASAVKPLSLHLSGKAPWHPPVCQILKDAYLSNNSVQLVYDISYSDPSCSIDAEPVIFMIGIPNIY
jgi:hypothetical protein